MESHGWGEPEFQLGARLREFQKGGGEGALAVQGQDSQDRGCLWEGKREKAPQSLSSAPGCGQHGCAFGLCAKQLQGLGDQAACGGSPAPTNRGLEGKSGVPRIASRRSTDGTERWRQETERVCGLLEGAVRKQEVTNAHRKWPRELTRPGGWW